MVETPWVDSTLDSKVKALLYRIRWKNKPTIKDVQKFFKNISDSFMLAET